MTDNLAGAYVRSGGIAVEPNIVGARRFGWWATLLPPAAVAETQRQAVRLLVAELREMADRLEKDLLAADQGAP